MQTKVKKIVAKVAHEEEVKDSDRLINDLGMDSLDCIDLVCELEDEFGIDIPDEDAEDWETVAQVVKYVEGRVVK